MSKLNKYIRHICFDKMASHEKIHKPWKYEYINIVGHFNIGLLRIGRYMPWDYVEYYKEQDFPIEEKK